MTSSFGWTSAPARVAMTSLAFMFDEVPEPVWKTSIGNWSSSSPRATRSAAAAMRSALSGSSSPSSALTRAAAALMRPEPARNCDRDRLAGDREVRDRLARLGAPKLVCLGRRRLMTESSRAPTLVRAASSSSCPAAELDARAARAAPERPLALRRSPPSRRSRRRRRRAAPEARRALRPPLRSSAGLRVVEQRLDRLGRVLLVRPDDAARAALDPAGAVEAARADAVRRRATRPPRFGITPRSASKGTPATATPR